MTLSELARRFEKTGNYCRKLAMEPGSLAHWQVLATIFENDALICAALDERLAPEPPKEKP